MKIASAGSLHGWTRRSSSIYSWLFVILLLLPRVWAWEQCEFDGIQSLSYCPDDTLCCPTSQGAAMCVPVAKSGLPNTTKTGQCCAYQTACLSGYECVVKNENDENRFSQKATNSNHHELPNAYCQPTNHTQSTDPYAHDVPQYQMCQMADPSMLQLQGFPISDASSETTFHLGYYSNLGSITEDRSQHESIERAVIILHGSLRDADDYFCTGLTWLDNDDAVHQNNTLVLAPWFASVNDDMDQASIVPGTTKKKQKQLIPRNLLVWQDVVEAYDWYFWHLWRYGADAHNAPISSFIALDRMVEHVATSFPNLQQITVVGHSAGGQMAHRWALLSNTPTWGSKSIALRAVVANPRSYLYLDDRRWLPSACDNPGDCSQKFQRPSQEVRNQCPQYDLYCWGLQSGGNLPCPYRDSAMAALGNSPSAMANRYASRDVIYLSAEYDVLPQYHDHCAALWQGRNRNERARNYFAGLQEYFGRPVHEFHFVPFSGHDHALMFQSEVGRAVILGKRKDPAEQNQQAEIRLRGVPRKDVSQNSRFIHPIDLTNDE